MAHGINHHPRQRQPKRNTATHTGNTATPIARHATPNPPRQTRTWARQRRAYHTATTNGNATLQPRIGNVKRKRQSVIRNTNGNRNWPAATANGGNHQQWHTAKNNSNCTLERHKEMDMGHDTQQRPITMRDGQSMK